MTRPGKSTVLVIAALAAHTLVDSNVAGATPLGQAATPAITSHDLQQAQWRGGGRGGWSNGPGWWGASPVVVGGALVGGVLVAAAIAEHRAQPEAKRACARDFRSYDPASGTFIDNRGDARICPYLY